MPDCAVTLDFAVATVEKETVQQSVGVDCCVMFEALASKTSTAKEFNDVFLAVGKKASVSDAFSFIVKKNGFTIPNLGTTVLFPQSALEVGFIYDWAQYLAIPPYGAGIYSIYEVKTFLGSVQERLHATIKVWEYTEDKAHGSFAINTTFNNLSKVGENFIDFTGSEAHSTLRMKGKFGQWQAQTKTKTLVDHAYKANVTSSNNDNKFTLTVNPITFLHSNRFVNLHLLCGTEHLITDHNYNHRKYTLHPCEYITDTINQDEIGINVPITADFSDFTKDKITRHNKQ